MRLFLVDYKNLEFEDPEFEDKEHSQTLDKRQVSVLALDVQDAIAWVICRRLAARDEISAVALKCEVDEVTASAKMVISEQ